MGMQFLSEPTDEFIDPQVQIVPIYFDVPDFSLPLEEFIQTAKATKQVIDTLNKELFDSRLKYDIYVFPPEKGSFKSRLGIVLKKTPHVIGALGIIGLGLESDIGQGYIKGLTGHTPAYWAEKIGERHGEYFRSDREDQADISKDCAALILSESTKGFLKQDYSSLIQYGITKQKFKQAYVAKNSFYETCYKQGLIQGIGFSENEKFPIQRKDFPNLITDVSNTEDDDEKEWQVEIRYIKVTSPNWDRDDINRTWRAKYTQYDQTKYTTFFIEDDSFWWFLGQGKLTSNGIDTLKVQWAYIEDHGRRSHTKVIRVLEFNNFKISDAMSDEELSELLQGYKKAKERQGQLFNDEA